MNKTNAENKNKREKNKRLILLILGVLILIIAIIIIMSLNNDNNPSNTKEPSGERGVLGELSIKISKDFETSDANNENYKRYSLSDEDDYCYIVFTSTHLGSYETAKDYLEKNIYTSVDGYKEVDINDSKWTTVSLEEETSKTIYYAIKGKDKIYNVEYLINKDSGECTKEIDDMIESMELE